MERGTYDGTCKLRNGVINGQFLYKNHGILNEAGGSQTREREALFYIQAEKF